MGRRRTRIVEPVRRAIQAAALRPVPPAATVLQRELEHEFEDQAPSLRTVQLLLSRYIPADKGEWWRFGDGDPDDDATVLAVVAELYRHGEDFGGLATRLRGTIRRTTAQWVIRVRAVAEEMEVADCYEFARRFDACEQAGTDNSLIGLALGLGVWRSVEDERAIVASGLLPADWARIDREEAFA